MKLFSVMVPECTRNLSVKAFFGGETITFPDIKFKFMISQIQYSRSFRTVICILCYTDKYHKWGHILQFEHTHITFTFMDVTYSCKCVLNVFTGWQKQHRWCNNILWTKATHPTHLQSLTSVKECCNCSLYPLVATWDNRDRDQS
jgi:hypothetical protein